MTDKYTIIFNGEYYGDYATEDDAVRVADDLYTRNKRSTVRVLHDDDILFELP